MIKLQARDLYKALNQVKHTEVSTLPVLNHALLELTDDGVVFRTVTLTLQGKDGKTSDPVHYWGNGERWETCVPLLHVVNTYPNGGCVPHKRKLYPFLDYLRVMAEFQETLELSFDPEIQTLTVKAGESCSEFKCMDAAEFPPVDKE